MRGFEILPLQLRRNVCTVRHANLIGPGRWGMPIRAGSVTPTQPTKAEPDLSRRLRRLLSYLWLALAGRGLARPRSELSCANYAERFGHINKTYTNLTQLSFARCSIARWGTSVQSDSEFGYIENPCTSAVYEPQQANGPRRNWFCPDNKSKTPS